MRVRLFALGFFAAVSISSVAAAEGSYRRAGLGGAWTKRHLTAPLNSLVVLAGPGQNPTFGQRFDQRVIDAGGQYSRNRAAWPASGLETQGWTRFGVAFGLTEDWEA